MIIGFKCSETGKIWRGDVSRRLPENIQLTARKKLRMLNNAHTIKDLMIPPANRLESLKGDLVGRYSIRIMINGAFVFHGKITTPMMLKL